jgi:hypothetical protein
LLPLSEDREQSLLFFGRVDWLRSTSRAGNGLDADALTPLPFATLVAFSGAVALQLGEPQDQQKAKKRIEQH